MEGIKDGFFIFLLPPFFVFCPPISPSVDQVSVTTHTTFFDETDYHSQRSLGFSPHENTQAQNSDGDRLSDSLGRGKCSTVMQRFLESERSRKEILISPQKEMIQIFLPKIPLVFIKKKSRTLRPIYQGMISFGFSLTDSCVSMWIYSALATWGVCLPKQNRILSDFYVGKISISWSISPTSLNEASHRN